MTTSRYTSLVKIASGGTAVVHVGAQIAPPHELVALKIPHAHLAGDQGFHASLLTEARISSRIAHPNVVRVREVEPAEDDAITLVMDWVDGAALSELIRSYMKEPPPRVAALAIRIVLDACEGLHAAHELRGDDGALLGLVHRDVSPQNVLVGRDGVAKLVDFGLAKPLYAAERTTSEGALRGKLGYMAPEYVKNGTVDRKTDVFALGVVLWESLARRRLFRGDNDGQTIDKVREASIPKLEALMPEVSKVAAAALDSVLMRALAKHPDDRFPTARALGDALADVAKAHDLVATHEEVAASFGPTLAKELDARRAAVDDKLAALARSAPAEVSARSVPPVAAPISPTTPIANPAKKPMSRVIWALVAVGLVVVAAFPIALIAKDDSGEESSVASQSGTSGSMWPSATIASTSASASEPSAPISASATASAGASAPSSIGSALPVVAPPSRPKHPRPNPYTR